MSTSAIVPVSSAVPSLTGIDFGAATATPAQQTVLNNLLNQLQQAVSLGDLTSAATLVNAIDALSPSSVGSSSPLGTYLTSLGSAINDGSITEAQSALATYQTNVPAVAAPSTPASGANAAAIAASLVQSEVQLNLVTELLGPSASLPLTPATTSSPSSANSLISILNAAYPTSNTSASTSVKTSTSSPTSTSTSSPGSTPSTGTSATGSTPYDALVSAIQASLAAGQGTITPALAYLQANGNFVDTSA
jgi:hypothetical protein